MSPSLPATELLALYPAIGALDGDVLAALCDPKAVVSVNQGAELFAEQQPCHGFPLLISGTIKIVKCTPAGREMLLYRVEPGDSCVITSSCLLGHVTYTACGIAETSLRMVVLPERVFECLIAQNAAFRDFVFRLFAERLADMMLLLEEVAFHRLDQRLAKLLLAKAEPIQATHQLLADELGSVREMISRLLKGFAAQGLVSLGRERIRVLDRNGLRQVAGLDRPPPIDG
ncbi:Crp/Fnr family transcriptional regulator [Propionivibrio sp.]|uniref:Crp/Fnr family transcriptional regulator n=1 Tax=Propionivibrio sp. TaxID=2212460 RepID=UPI0025E9ECAA|nr:Crp/Fnr family transcriptional regulator [Propionivibrio sp.]MBK7355725.1 Crp/Fnr family transcriptional regulator [Propionivibrio sp.]